MHLSPKDLLKNDKKWTKQPHLENFNIGNLAQKVYIFWSVLLDQDIPRERSDLTFSAGLCWQVNRHIEQPLDILSAKNFPKRGAVWEKMQQSPINYSYSSSKILSQTFLQTKTFFFCNGFNLIHLFGALFCVLRLN